MIVSHYHRVVSSTAPAIIHKSGHGGCRKRGPLVGSRDDEFEIAEPRAGAMIESLRAVGYSTKTAVADLIDNSITAGARTIWLRFWWAGQSSYVSILDDGRGMTEAELSAAMRPGSASPLDDRSEGDLGRFGLGLKTASFSQCRRLTVASLALDGHPAVRRWDLDYVVRHDAWRLLKTAAAESSGRLTDLGRVDYGTVVLWEQLDRIVGDADVADEQAQASFRNLIDDVRLHLEMVFHRFLQGAKPHLRILLNGTDAADALKPWDPFLEDHAATLRTPVETIALGAKGTVRVQGFVLPHKDKLGEERHRQASGPAGWNAQQGFYVYRNDRLVVAGSWLGIGGERPWTKEEHYKLARIRLDIPNTMDAEWGLDVKKSTARPPARVRRRLKGLADNVRKDAREVFAHRGTGSSRASGKPTTRVWLPATHQGRLSYRIDRKHPLVVSVLASSGSESPADAKALLRLLEETVPVQQIWLDQSEKPDLHAGPFEGASEKDVRDVMGAVFRALKARDHLSDEQARQRLFLMEPFGSYPEIIATLSSD